MYRGADLEAIGRIAFGKDALASGEKESIELVFIQAVLNNHDGRNLLVTADDLLPRKRLWYESHFPGGRLNIVTTQEAIEIMDLVAKSKGKYIISASPPSQQGSMVLVLLQE